MLTCIKNIVSTHIESSFRSPSGLSGWFCRKKMQTINNDSIITGIQRLGLKESDTYCEIGAGDGLGIKSIIEPDASSLIDEMVYVRVPARIILVEISDDFRRQLLRVVNHDIPEKFRSRIEVHGHDCKHMHFLSDNSVDTIFAMNVVYIVALSNG